MQFAQLFEYRTSRIEEVTRALDQWIEQTRGKRTALRGFIARDREEPDRYVDLVVFPSYEDAMRNSDLPETQAFAEKLASLCDGEPTFRNLDLVRDDDLR